MPQIQRTFEAEVAVLQTEFKNLDGKFDEIKHEVKLLDKKVDHYADTTHTLLKEFKVENQQQHKVVEEKIQSLEKWRWMLMGAGLLIGMLGYSGIEKFLLH